MPTDDILFSDEDRAAYNAGDFDSMSDEGILLWQAAVESQGSPLTIDDSNQAGRYAEGSAPTFTNAPTVPLQRGMDPTGWPDGRAMEEGMRYGFQTPFYGAAQRIGEIPLVKKGFEMLGRDSPFPNRADVDARRESVAHMEDRPGWGTGQFLGGMGAALPIMGVTKNPFVAGGTFGAVQPTGEGESRLLNTGIGTATGILPWGISQGLRRWNTPAPGYDYLRNRGVTVPPGKARGGAIANMEEKLQSTPLVGDKIMEAGQTANRQWNLAALNEAIAPIQQTVSKIGYEGLDAAKKLVGNVYKQVEGKLTALNPVDDAEFVAASAQLDDMVNALSDTAQTTYRNNIRTNFTDKLTPAGTMSPSQWFTQLREIRNYGFGLTKSDDIATQQVGQALMQFGENMTKVAVRQNPEIAPLITSANSAWRNLYPVERAVTFGTEGVFTPGNLVTSGRMLNRDAWSRGTAPMQEFANIGNRVLGNRLPNSGTADRVANLGALGGLGVMGFSNPLAAAGTAAGIASARGLYTQPAINVLNRGLSRNLTGPPTRQTVLGQELLNRVPGTVSLGLGQGLLGQ